MVRCEAWVEAEVGLRLVGDVVLEEGGVGGQVLVSEAGADLADALVLLVLRLVAGEEEAAVLAGSLAAAEVAAKYHQVQGVTHSLGKEVRRSGGQEVRRRARL